MHGTGAPYQVGSIAHVFEIPTGLSDSTLHRALVWDFGRLDRRLALGVLGRHWVAVGGSGTECVHLQPSPFDHLSLPDFRPEGWPGDQEPHLSVYEGDPVRSMHSDRGSSSAPC